MQAKAVGQPSILGLQLPLGELRRGDLERVAIGDVQVGELSDLERARSVPQTVDVGHLDRERRQCGREVDAPIRRITG